MFRKDFSAFQYQLALPFASVQPRIGWKVHRVLWRFVRARIGHVAQRRASPRRPASDLDTRVALGATQRRSRRLPAVPERREARADRSQTKTQDPEGVVGAKEGDEGGLSYHPRRK